MTEAQLLSAALGNSPESVSIYGLDSTVLYMNPATERIMGVRFEDVRGKRLFELYPDAIDNAFHRAFQRVAAGGDAETFEHYYPRFDGWFANRVCRIGNHVHVYVRDVTDAVWSTDRERSERDAERRATARLESLLVVTAQLAGAARRDDVERVLVEASYEALGATFAAMWTLSTDGRELVLVRERGMWPELIATYRRLDITAPGPISDCVRRGRSGYASKCQELAMRSFVSVPLVSGDRVLGALALASRTHDYDELDVSIAIELANHAAAAIDNARLFDDLRIARREAEDANRAKDEFLAMLGHELRNPLAPLVTALELMHMRAPEQFQRERAVIERQVDHLSRLVDDLLDVSRITRGKVDLRRERLPLASVTSKAIEQTSPLFEQSRHRLAVDVTSELYVYGDAIRLAQVVANLLSNAAKYTPAGGAIEISARRDAGAIEIAVRDNGVGITADMLPQIFELFVQAPQPRARTRGGLGLGLTIVKSLVEMHGGTVTAASEGKDKGSVLTIRLPEATEPIAVTEAERAPQLPRASVARRVLVVDDNEDAANLLAEVLVAHGHHIRTAADGPSALRIADEFQPEVAVLDIGLPVMDGYELAERMRSAPHLRNLRLIAVTGYGQESDRERALDAGFHAHLAKPVAIDTLVRLVDVAS